MALPRPIPTRRLFTRRLTARVVALTCAAPLALSCVRWAGAQGDGLGARPAPPSMPALTGATAWINSPPLDTDALRGKVVLVDFWTYSCINCLRTLPYLRAWWHKYAAFGLVVVGVHTPEFSFEQAPGNVQKAVEDLDIGFPVAVDSHQALWNAFGTRAWPSFYFVDAAGRIRGRQLGEGRYDVAERMLQQLLREAGRQDVPTDLVAPLAQGAQAAPGARIPLSDETYVGAARAEGFVSLDGRLRATPQPIAFTPAPRLRLNDWTLSGSWHVADEYIEARQAGARIAYRFRSRDLHLVMGHEASGPVRFRVRIDGQAPGRDHGSDIDAQGLGQVDAQRLYQLVRQAGDGAERLFEIEFLDPGARAYSFTFG